MRFQTTNALHYFRVYYKLCSKLTKTTCFIEAKETIENFDQTFKQLINSRMVSLNYYSQHIMTDLNSLGGKKELKAKVGDLMQQYEKSKQDQLQYKQQMKQNIMLQILNNRQKTQQTSLSPKKASQKISVTTHTNVSDPISQEPIIVPPLNKSKMMKANQVQVINNIHTLSIERNKPQKATEQLDQANEFAEITFKGKKPYQSADQDSSYGQHQLQAIKIKNQQDYVQDNKSINMISKYALKYQKYVANKKTEKQPQGQQNQFNQSSVSRSSLIQSKEKISSYNNILAQPPKHQKPIEDDSKSKVTGQIIKQDEDLLQENQQQNCVFLTMDESQSMTASQVPKNIAFQIKMDRSQDPDQLELYKQQKIKQFQKKRQERMQQFRRNQSQKKVQLPKARNSINKRVQKNQRSQETLQVPTPKSNAGERKGITTKPPKAQIRLQRDKSQLVPLQPQQSHYQIRQNISKPYSQMFHGEEEVRKPPVRQNAFLMMEDQPPKALSPFRTPKTVMADNRSKSGQRNSNIFAGESGVRQKSGLKLEPKIEPKQRKNSFSRQSNKKLMVNAITHVCFPGQLNRKQRQKLIQVLQNSQYEFFVFLFKEYSRKIIKGIYTLDNSQSKLQRIYGEKSPQEIAASQVQQFYRFDSGSRQFKKVDGCRSFSLAIHAIDLK